MEFHSPKYLQDAFDLLDQDHKALKICAGMTHVLRFYKNFPNELGSRFKGVLHVGDLASLSECREEMGHYVIGATTRISSLQSDPLIARYAPALLDAAHATSTPQVRNRRTVGGEIAWGSYYSPLIATLLVLGANVRVRQRSNEVTFTKNVAGHNSGYETTYDLNDFYEGELERATLNGKTLQCRNARTHSQDLILKISLPPQLLNRPGGFSFFRALHPKISTENSGLVVAVSGVAQNGIIQSAQMVTAGLWMSTLCENLPLEGVRMSDVHIFEKLYSFCERYSLSSYRRGGPPEAQLSLILFGLLKEGFSALLGR